MLCIFGYIGDIHIQRGQRVPNFSAQPIGTNTAHRIGIRAELPAIKSKIYRRPSEPFPVGENIPKQFANSYNYKSIVHIIP